MLFHCLFSSLLSFFNDHNDLVCYRIFGQAPLHLYNFDSNCVILVFLSSLLPGLFFFGSSISSSYEGEPMSVPCITYVILSLDFCFLFGVYTFITVLFV